MHNWNDGTEYYNLEAKLKEAQSEVTRLTEENARLREALQVEAERQCQLCENKKGYEVVFEKMPHRDRINGKFYHARHDKASGGAWMCSAQVIRAALESK